MSVRYVAVNWNRQKRIYDTVLGLSVPALVGLFFVTLQLSHPHLTAETGLIRGLGLTAFVLLHVILCIGPLCRLDPGFLPLLYNRRHLGVSMCVVALAHAGFATFQFHAFGDRNPLVSLLVSNTAFGSLAGFPFELLGLAALLVIILMAATSHDFWLSVLSPPVWKALHMLVYLAYALLIGHVALGTMQAESGVVGPLMLAAGAAVVLGLHVAAGLKEHAQDRPRAREDWVVVCGVDEIKPDRARLALVGGERVAVFRHADGLSAVSNVCKHQNGPLGEGRIIDGCITCPWHGYQYRPETGTSPPPFDDKVPTFELRVEKGQVKVRREANPAGTHVRPVPVPTAGIGAASASQQAPRPFYVGYQPQADPALARRTRRAVALFGTVAAVTMVGLALAQEPFADSRFEYGSPRELTGTIVSRPYPRLAVTSGTALRQYLLAAPGKHGAETMALPYDGRRVRLVGTLAQRGNAAMLEVDSIAPLDAAPAGALVSQQRLGPFSLSGEIVDSKCWTGVMNPGQGKTHLDCAVRCLSGGLPPLLVIRDATGRERHLVLTDASGAPMPRSILPAVGRPVRIRGQVVREGELLFLRAAPGAIELLAR